MVIKECSINGCNQEAGSLPHYKALVCRKHFHQLILCKWSRKKGVIRLRQVRLGMAGVDGRGKVR